jgi:uncharacterized protein YjbJ (UPF0337 family)
MNNSAMSGNWNVLKGKIRQQWGKLTDNDVETFKGNAEEAWGRLQKVYGYSKDEARREYDNFRNSNSTLFNNEQPKI